MARKVISLRYPAKCADPGCGAELPVGARARWYGRGKVYGIGCHAGSALVGTVDGEGVARPAGKLVWWGGQQVRGTHCEDAPCCGCCGPQGDEPEV